MLLCSQASTYLRRKRQRRCSIRALLLLLLPTPCCCCMGTGVCLGFHLPIACSEVGARGGTLCAFWREAKRLLLSHDVTQALHT